ncbi:N utilization substance protein B [Iodidimonas muriae]|uniref:Transcription antitermination protein NusB n=1 Tax=Iodidimonas muriae TaxID=261467 RepID=A0ABQ2LFY7_9PROT|nr:transcription antitermination factor NusB [Iodidimonas muriae]GER08330.1 N utilization substance protein B [Kordiimonadales bacterium JCM 17843]GGO16269.1 N utilization substance protein B [Iodidimonas muriae]
MTEKQAAQGPARPRKGKKPSGGARSAARLGAVQALYQLEHNPDADPRHVVTEFRAFRLGREIEGDQYADADQNLFADIVLGTIEQVHSIDDKLKGALAANWPLDRLESVLRAILRAATYELTARPDVPTAVVINEYMDVAHAFFDGAEPAFANGVLDRLARDIRS